MYLSEGCSVMSDSLRPMDCTPWNSSGQNTGEGSLSLLQGIFPTQGSNPGLLHCRWLLYQLSYKGSPNVSKLLNNHTMLWVSQIKSRIREKQSENKQRTVKSNSQLEATFLCCCCSVAELSLILCDAMYCSMPGFPVLQYLPESNQIYVHRVSDAIQRMITYAMRKN